MGCIIVYKPLPFRFCLRFPLSPSHSVIVDTSISIGRLEYRRLGLGIQAFLGVPDTMDADWNRYARLQADNREEWSYTKEY